MLGPNGAGKTTSFYIVVGLLAPDSGKVYLGQEDITSQPIHIRARKGVSYLPQNVSIFKKLTVRENLLAVMDWSIKGRQRKRQLLDYLLNRFQIEGVVDTLGAALSGGERRRVEIARALVFSPHFYCWMSLLQGLTQLLFRKFRGLLVN